MPKKYGAKKATKKTTTRPTTKKGTKKAANQSSPSFDDYLDSLDSAWEESRESTPTKGGGGVNHNVVDGIYVAQVAQCVIRQSRSADRPPFMSTKLVIAVGELQGEQLSMIASLDDELRGNSQKSGLDRISETLQLLGHDTKKMRARDIPKICDKITAEQPYVRINVSNSYVAAEDSNDGKEHYYQNIYINELMTEEDVNELL